MASSEGGAQGGRPVLKTGVRATSPGFDSCSFRVTFIDVDAILELLGDTFDDPGDDPWGGANLYWFSGGRAHVVRNKDLDVSIDDNGGAITLGDLRWLVESCTDLDDSSRVDVQGGKSYNQFDRDPATISVRGKLKKN